MTARRLRRLERQGLYDPFFEHDACGVGFVANITGVRSHDIIRKGLQVLENLTHRGACGCDPLTGDGAGMLMQIPHEFLRKACAPIDVELPAPGEYGVGLVFLPPDVRERNHCEQQFAKIVREEGQRLLGWRQVPVDDSKCGSLARENLPEIRQVFIGRGRETADAGGARAQAVRHPQAHRATDPRVEPRRPRVLLRPQPLGAHAGLQGPAPARADPRLLPRPRRPGLRERARARPPALQHQHLPVVGPRPPVPLHRAQRRDQHAARQHQLDARPPERCSPRRCSATTSRRSCRSSSRTAATRRCSTTPWSCSPTPGARCRTRS